MLDIKGQKMCPKGKSRTEGKTQDLPQNRVGRPVKKSKEKKKTTGCSMSDKEGLGSHETVKRGWEGKLGSQLPAHRQR